jgi:hypothetical protein
MILRINTDHFLKNLFVFFKLKLLVSYLMLRNFEFMFVTFGIVYIHKATAKVVPLQATEALGWRGGIAPTHSQPRH